VPFEKDLILIMLGLIAMGSGVFLRIVAREKVRRERHLELRYFEMIQEAEDELPDQRPAEVATVMVHE